MRISVALSILAGFLFAAVSAKAQFSGSVGFELESASNIQRLDTTSPDVIAMPSVVLSYQLNPSAVTQIPATVAWLPGYYGTNTSLSYTAISLAVTPTFYLSHQADITAEARSERSTSVGTVPAQNTSEVLPAAVPKQAEHRTDAPSNDQLVGVAITDLYDLSVGLDSTTITPTGLKKSQAQGLEDLRDSISEAAVTVADLLDSLGYSESAVSVLIPELVNLLGPLERLRSHVAPSLSALQDHLNNAIAELRGTIPLRSDDAITEGTTAARSIEVEPIPQLHGDELLEPPITLISAISRLRDFGASDIGLREDLLDSSAKTLATKFTVPVSYYAHTGAIDSLLSPDGNPNDSRILGLGAALDIYSSRSAGYRLSFDLIKSTYPFDSVYTNTESRLRLGARFGLGDAAALFGNAAIGFRNYSSTFQFLRQQGPKKGTLTQVAGDFTQYSLGLGLMFLPSDRFSFGGLAAINRNVNLRAYITNAGISLSKKKIRPAAQIADDEYTYDLTRGAIFATTRLPADIDLGLDLAYEHRTYGTVANKVAQQFVEGAGRTDNGTYSTASFSKLIVFDDRVIGVFDGLSLEVQLGYSDIASTDTLYTYSDFDILAGFTLSF
jgi:hypothetical protein